MISALDNLSNLENAAHQSDRPIADEALLCMDNIQGNGIVGFNKDHQAFIFLKIQNVAGFKSWLASQLGFIATAAEVLAFNRLFKATKARRGQEGAVKATWTNIVISASGLQQLISQQDFAVAGDSSFRAGLAAQSPALNDPSGSAIMGDPTTWEFGGPSNVADVMLIVASDDQADLIAERDRLLKSIADQNPASPCATKIFDEEGATLPGDLRGHEHFGWRDGISQPGVRGVVSSDKTASGRIDLLTTRQNPNDASQGQPGQDCLYPGEFVFGYAGQSATDPDASGPSVSGGVNLFDDGSLVVVRKLRQDVAGFSQTLSAKAQADGIDLTLLGAKLVGRFKDGSPLVADDTASHLMIGSQDALANWFEFQNVPPHGTSRKDDSQFDLGTVVPQNDPAGAKCPFAAHVRKMYPRDDNNDAGLSEAFTQTHRMLRRGIPFGSPYDSSVANDDGNRGLFFVSYQTSIIKQFEFVIKSWANNEKFKTDGVGYDPIIGQSSSADRDRSSVRITFTGQRDPTEIDLPKDFVVAVGGGYFVSLSLDALAKIADTASPIRCLGGHPVITDPPPPGPVGYAQ